MATVFRNRHTTGALASRAGGFDAVTPTAARSRSKGRLSPISHLEDWASAPEEFRRTATEPPSAE